MCYDSSINQSDGEHKMFKPVTVHGKKYVPIEVESSRCYGCCLKTNAYGCVQDNTTLHACEGVDGETSDIPAQVVEYEEPKEESKVEYAHMTREQILKSQLETARENKETALQAVRDAEQEIRNIQCELLVVKNPPTWKNTVHQPNGNNFETQGSVFSMGQKLGYSYMLWNDRIYHLATDMENTDTGLTVYFLNKV